MDACTSRRIQTKLSIQTFAQDMTISSWMMYLTVVILSTLTPGPAVLLSVTNAIGQGPRASIFSSLGNISGLLVLSAAAMTGIGAVLQSSTTVFTVLKAVGAGYLIYLGVRKWQSVDTGFGIDVEALANRTPSKLYSQGVLIALTNPKALVFFAALFPQFIDTASPLVPQFISLTGTLMFFSFAALMAYALLANYAKEWLAVPKRARAFNRISGSAFVLLGLGMLRLKNGTS
jgi:threonine/homoserine/homoserine lactone efflux protein